MFQGNLKIQKVGNTYQGKLQAYTPMGPFTIDVSAPTLGKTMDNVHFVSSFLPISTLVGPRSTMMGATIYHGIVNPEPKVSTDYLKILRRLGDVAKTKQNNAAKDIGWVVGQMLQKEIVNNAIKKQTKPIYVPVTPDPTKILKNLDERIERGDKRIKKARTIFRALQSGDAQKMKRGMGLYKNNLKQASLGSENAKKVLKALEQYSKAVLERRRQEVSGFSEIGFSFSDLTKQVKKWGKKTLALERKFRKHVTKNKALVAMIPYAGPFIVAGAEILNRIDNGDPEAIKKVAAMKALADKGNPKAQKAMKGLFSAEMLRQAVKESAKQEAGAPQSEIWKAALRASPDQATEAQKWAQYWDKAVQASKQAGMYETPGDKLEKPDALYHAIMTSV